MSHIFISYSRNDIGFAQKIVDALAANDLDTWIDWKSIPKGEKWLEEIYRGIEGSDAFVFLVSPDSVISYYCKKEIEHAVKNNKRIIPIVVGDSDPEITPSAISERNWIFCREGQDDFDKSIAETRETVHTDYEWPKYHTSLQVKALEWERTKDTSRLLRGNGLHEAGQQLTIVGSQKDPQSTQLQRQFILVSQRDEVRRRGRTATVSISAGIIMVALGIYGLVQANLANERAKIALARQLAAQAQSINTTRSSKQMIAVLLAVQSMKIFPSSEAAQVLQINDYLASPIATMVHNDSIYSVSFSPDGNYVATGSNDTTARVWEAFTGREVVRMTHDGEVDSVAFSPDGKYVVLGSGDGAIYVWETFTGKEVAHMNHDSSVFSIGFSLDGDYIVSSGSKDFTARVWEVSTSEEIACMTHESVVVSAAFSPDGNYVVSGSMDVTGSGDNTIRVWDAFTGEEITRMTHDDGVNTVVFSPDGQYVISGSADSTARVWEAFTGKEITRTTHNDHVSSIAFSPDGKYAISGGWDNTARVWETFTRKETACVMYDGPEFSLLVSPDGKYEVVSSGYDYTARVLEISTGKEVARMKHDDSVVSASFSPDGKYAVSGSWDKTARVWEAFTGKEVTRMNHDAPVYHVYFSPDGKYVVSGSKDGPPRGCLWQAEDLIVNACLFLPRNLTRAEWEQYIGDALPYQVVCPNLPIEPVPTVIQ